MRPLYVTDEFLEPGIVLITLSRPERLNALNFEMVEQLIAAVERNGHDSSCRVMILTGAGRGFCSGIDLRGYGTIPGDDTRGYVQQTLAMQRSIAKLVPTLRAVPQPIIAAVNGPATGGGLSLVLASDVRIASPSARFSAAFVKLGLSGCDISTSWTLPKLIGMGKAHEMMLTGRLLDAEEAARCGLVLEVTGADGLLDRSLETARLIIANSSTGVAMTKAMMWNALEVPAQHSAMELENVTQVLLVQTEDHSEARSAFLSKRDPRFLNK